MKKHAAKFIILIGLFVAMGFILIMAMARTVGVLPEQATTTTVEDQGDLVLRNDPLITYVPDEEGAAAALTYSEPIQSVYSPDFGPKDAPLELFLFSDYECPACRTFSAELNQAILEFPDQVHLIWKDFPLPRIHPNALEAAEAARCAMDQGKYWGYSDSLFINQSRLGEDLYQELVETLELDEKAFLECRSLDKYTRFIEQDYIEGSALGIEGTPTLFINGEQYTGGMTKDALIPAFQSAINEATN